MPAKVRVFRAVAALVFLVLISTGCASSQPESAGEVDIAATIAVRVEESQSAEEEPDIEATIAYSVAATQTALALQQDSMGDPSPEPVETQVFESGSDNEPVEDSTPEPVEAQEPESGSDSEPSTIPAVDSNPELMLPFWDDFDQGLDPVWRVINGRPLVVEGRLTSANDELSLELGNTNLKNYTIEMDVGGEDCGTGYNNYLKLGFSPTLLYRIKYIDFGGRAEWYAFEDNDWDKLLSGGDRLDCGHFRIVVNGNSYQIFINGQLAEDIVFEPAMGPLLVVLDENVFIDNFQIKP